MNKYIVIIIALFLNACGTTPTKPEPVTEKISKVTYSSFCKDFVDHLNDNKAEFISENFDVETLARNTFVGVDLKPKVKKKLHAKINKFLPNQVFIALQAELKTRERWYSINTPSDRRCVIHSELSDQGLYMLEFLMSDTSGTIKFVDFQNYMLNLTLSSAMREVFRNLLAKGEDKALATARLGINHFSLAAKSKDINKTISAFNALPEELQKNPVYIQRLLTVIPATHEKYFEVIAPLETIVDDDDKGLIFIDYYADINNLGGILKIVDNIEKRTSRDAIFEVLRASSYLLVGKKSQFLHSMYEAIRLGSRYEDSYWMLFSFFNDEKLFDDAILTLKILEDSFGYSFERNTFVNQRQYGNLLASVEFNQWLNSK